MRWLNLLAGLWLLAGFSGCVTRATAEAQARAAFMAGQQSVRMHQLSQAASVNFLGPVKNAVIAWREDLTLAQALVEAEYVPKTDPSLLVLVRRGHATLVTPKQLLGGQDIPLEAGDVVEIKQ